jgi:hypothetical protein
MMSCRLGDGTSTIPRLDRSNIGSAKKAVMETSSAPADQVFVLRFWRETHQRDRACASWRVKISHVNSRRHLHAHGLDFAFEIVRSELESSLGNPPEPQQ